MKHVLFVDDEPKILQAMKRILFPLAEAWKMTFVESGEAALEALAATPYDVLITDMRMPGMDGAELLAHTAERYPSVARFVLSGQAGVEAILRAVPVTHQFLAKPCEPSVLRELVERACGLQDLLGNSRVREAVGKVRELPSRPKVYGALARAVADPRTSSKDVAEIVEQDMAMCAKILQLANSAFFGLRHPVSNIQGAVVQIGTAMLQNLVLSCEVRQAFVSANGVLSLDTEQEHALRAATLARGLVTDRQKRDDAFMAAMLHDVGKLVLATQMTEEFRAAVAKARQDRVPLHEVEPGVYGVSHAEVGGYLLGLWGLPYPIVEAVARHHAPWRAVSEEAVDLADAVFLAEGLAQEQAAASAPRQDLPN